MIVPAKDVETYNSTTYADLLGVVLGLDRLPGEPAGEYLDRLEQASRSERGCNYVGVMNELALQLGLPLFEAMEITGPPGFFAEVRPGSLELQSDLETVSIPLVTYSPDSFWEWRLLSDVVADIQKTANYLATLLSEDGRTFTLLRQRNQIWVTSEAIEGNTVQLSRGPLVAGSEMFSTPVPAYQVTGDGRTLRFAAPVPSGCVMAYQYRRTPLRLVACPVALLNLSDPQVQQAAVKDGVAVYQMRDYLAEVAGSDQSYWGM